MKIIKILLFLTITSLSYAQSGAIYETYKQPNYQGDTNASTIFPKAIQEYNYIKTHRGIEVYRTYKHTNALGSATNRYYQSSSSIFSKSEPEYIIKKDGQVYRTYNYGTNKGSIFTKPFQSMSINGNFREKMSFDGDVLQGEKSIDGDQE